MSQPATPPARQREGRPINVWVPEDLRNALDTLRKRTRRSLTAEISFILEQYLAEQGLWTPPEE